MNTNTNISRKYAIYGSIFGLLFPLIGWSIDFWQNDLSFSIENLIYAHSQNNVLIIIDMAPFVLGIVAWLVGREVHQGAKKNSAILEAELSKSKLYSEFTEKMINGNFDFEIEIGDDAESDELEDSLLQLRDSLIENEEKERKQNWTAEGLSKFIEVLRSDVDNISDLTDRILANLVKYIDANQGAIFIIEKNEDRQGGEHLKMVSTYAYENKKFIEREIKLGEGLVGVVALEKSTKHLKEIPANYIKITSGLGESLPNHLLFVPLLLNEEIFGVIELASFKAIEEYKIKFVEKLSENIAATISGINTTEITQKLLRESREQTEAMRQQEEEMRQNMEELTATQEEMERKELEYQKRIEELEEQLSQSLKGQPLK